MLPILTEHLLIREVVASDAKFLTKLENDPITMRYLGGPTGSDEKSYQEGIVQAIADARDSSLVKLAQLVIELKEGKCPVGRCALRIPEVDPIR